MTSAGLRASAGDLSLNTGWGTRAEHRRCVGRCLAWLTLSSQPQPFCFPRPWQLLLCSSCAAEGTHRRCSYLSNRVNSWECNSCAGVGTGKMQPVVLP